MSFKIRCMAAFENAPNVKHKPIVWLWLSSYHCLEQSKALYDAGATYIRLGSRQNNELWVYDCDGVR